MRHVVRTSSRVAMGSAFSRDGCAMATMIAATTAMKSIVPRLPASRRHTSRAQTDTASRRGGGAIETLIVRMAVTKR